MTDPLHFTGSRALLGKRAVLHFADVLQWRPSQDVSTEVALALLCGSLDDAARDIEHLAGYATASINNTLRGIAKIISANWVAPEAARWMAGA